MRDPERIPMILRAVQRHWEQYPDLRLGQLLVNVARRQDHALFNLEDGELLEMIGPQTEEEHRYVREEPHARRRGWAEYFRRKRET